MSKQVIRKLKATWVGRSATPVGDDVVFKTFVYRGKTRYEIEFELSTYGASLLVRDIRGAIRTVRNQTAKRLNDDVARAEQVL